MPDARLRTLDKYAGTICCRERCGGAARDFREIAERQTRIASTNPRGSMPDARLPQEDRITPRQRSDDETNSGNWSSARLQRSVIPGGAWRIDEADCDSSSEGSSGRHIPRHLAL